MITSVLKRSEGIFAGKCVGPRVCTYRLSRSKKGRLPVPPGQRDSDPAVKIKFARRMIWFYRGRLTFDRRYSSTFRECDGLPGDESLTEIYREVA